MQDLKNLGFEEGMPKDWQTYSTGTTHRYIYPESGREGKGSSIAIEYPAREPGKMATLYQTIQIDNKKIYKLSGWMKTQNIVSNMRGAKVQIDWKDASGNYINTSSIMPIQKGTIPWTYFEGDVKPDPNADQASIVLALWDCSGMAWFDDISFLMNVPPNGPTLDKDIQVFYPSNAGNEYTKIKYDLTNVISYAFIFVNGDGSLYRDGSYNPDNLISYAHDRGSKVVLSFQARSFNDANNLLSNSAARVKAVSNLLNEVRIHNFDGIENDIENASGSQRDNMTLFQKELAGTFWASNPNYSVSVDVAITNWNNLFDGPAIKDHANYVLIMAYDVFHYNGAQAGPNAPINGDNLYWASVTKGIEYWTITGQIPREKILLGIPYYGYRWPTINNQRLAKTAGIGSYIHLNQIPSSYNYPRNWDNLWKTPWQAWQSGSQWYQLHYDDVESLGIKYDLVNSENLAGIGIWTITYGIDRPELWQLIQEKFKK